MNNVLITAASMSINNMNGNSNGNGSNNDDNDDNNKTSIEEKFMIGFFVIISLILIITLLMSIMPSSLHDKTYIITDKYIAIGRTVDRAEYTKVYNNRYYIYAKEIDIVNIKHKDLLFNITNIYSDNELTKFYCDNGFYSNKNIGDTIVVSKWFVKWRYELSIDDLINN
jgi:hypothetical protein